MVGKVIDDGDTATPVDLIEQTRIYPLADRAAPPEMVFPNGSATPANMVFPQDYRYFEMLAEFVEAVEGGRPVQTSGKDHLKTLGLTLACIESSRTGSRVYMDEFFRRHELIW